MRKFLCDAMCSELGRWLRTAGYDTSIVDSPLKDIDIFQKAVQENRLLLTRDQYFKKIDPSGKTVIYLEGESLDGWAKQLKEEQGIDWLYLPFSRCLKCNHLLEETKSTVNVPDKVREATDQFWFCSHCNQVFWRGSHTEKMEERLKSWQEEALLTIGLGGDLMIGRMVNKYLTEHPSFSIWGDLHPILRHTDLNIVNLETALTRSDKIVTKRFNFKADPEKVHVLLQGPIHAVNLANNHILDFSEEGLSETIRILDQASIQHVGAGIDLAHAKSPIIIEKKGMRIGLLGCTDNEPSWEAASKKAGTYFLSINDPASIRESIRSLRKHTDLLILSIHWGPNMKKEPLPEYRKLSREFIDLGVDIVHGHSAHVFQGVEIYKNKAILFDTGDLVDDYAIDPELRNDRSFFFIVEADMKGLRKIRLIPTVISNFQVNIAKGKQREEMFSEMQTLSKALQTGPWTQNKELIIDL